MISPHHLDSAGRLFIDVTNLAVPLLARAGHLPGKRRQVHATGRGREKEREGEREIQKEREEEVKRSARERRRKRIVEEDLLAFSSFD